MSDLRRYRAFISYSQKDKPFAKRLHRALESYRAPRGGSANGLTAKVRKLGRFFRDDEEMGAATNLGESLKGAIADSSGLVVVCSRNAAKSRWVDEEILHFKRTGRADKIFAVIIDGEPTPTDARKECFPPALRFELAADGSLSDTPAEPLGLDARRQSFGRLIARLAAGLLGIPFDALWKREVRRKRIRAVRVAALASVMMFAASAGAVFALKSQLQSRSDVLTQRAAEALDRRDLIEAQRFSLAAQNGANLPLIGFDATKAQLILKRALVDDRIVAAIQSGKSWFTAAKISPDGQMIATVSDGNTATISSTLTNATVATLKHEGKVLSLAFSDDGARLVTASADGTARVWSPDGKELGVLRGHKGRVNDAQFSADGSRIVTGGQDRIARMWDGATFQEISALAGAGLEVLRTRFAGDGRFVIASANDGVRVWDVATGTQVGTANVTEQQLADLNRRIDEFQERGDGLSQDARFEVRTHLQADFENYGAIHRAKSFALSADNSTLVMTSAVDELSVWNLKSGELIGKRLPRMLLDDEIVTKDFLAADLNVGAVGIVNPSSAVFDPKSYFAVQGKVDAVTRSQSGMVAWAERTAEAFAVRLHLGNANIEVLTCPLVDDQEKRPPRTILEFSKNSNFLLAANGSGLCVWRVAETASVQELRDPNVVWESEDVSVEHAVIDRQRGRVALLFDDDTISIFDTAVGKVQAWPGDDVLVPIAFSPDGLLLAADEEGNASLWDTISHKAVKKLAAPLRSVMGGFSPDGRYFASYDDERDLVIFDLSTGKALYSIKVGLNFRSVVFSPDGQWLVTIDDDFGARLGRISAGKFERTIAAGQRRPEWATFTADGRHVLVLGDGKLRRVSVVDGAESEVANGIDANGSDGVISPDEQVLAIHQLEQDKRQSLVLWNLATGGRELTLPEGGHLYSFSPDGRQIVVGGGSDDLSIRNVATGELLARAADVDLQLVDFTPDGKSIYIVTDSNDDGNAMIATYPATGVAKPPADKPVTESECQRLKRLGLSRFTPLDLRAAPQLDPARDSDPCEASPVFALWPHM